MDNIGTIKKIAMSTNTKGSKANLLLIIIATMVILLNPIQLQTTFAQTDNQGCKVEINGGAANMYPGQYTTLFANVTGQNVKNYTWTVEGPIIKDYDDNVYNSIHILLLF